MYNLVVAHVIRIRYVYVLSPDFHFCCFRATAFIRWWNRAQFYFIYIYEQDLIITQECLNRTNGENVCSRIITGVCG